MLCNYSFLLFRILALVFYVNAASTEAGDGCTFGGPVSSRSYFSGVVYSYVGDYQDTNYLANGYTSGGVRATSASVVHPFYPYYWYGGPFVLQFTGFFQAPETGLYVLSAYVKPQYDQQGIMVWFGSDMAFKCCQQQIPSDSADGSLMFLNGSATGEAYVLLEAGVYYPMRVVMASPEYNAQVKISLTTPNGSTITDLSPHIVQLPVEEGCTPVAVITSTTSESTAATFYWTGSNTFTSTYVFTTTDSSHVAHVVTESAAVIPEPPVFTTDVLSTTTVVTAFTAIDTTHGATPYVTTGTVVLVPSPVDCSHLSGLEKAECMNRNFDNGYYLGSADSCVDGQIACNADHDFAICDYGEWVVMDCAAGTSCFAFNFNGGEEVTVGCNFTDDMDEYEDDDANENADPEAS